VREPCSVRTRGRRLYDNQICAGGILIREAELTLCEDEVVLLDETLEGVLLEVDNVGSGGQSGCAEQT
jgi:hypothetical protein